MLHDKDRDRIDPEGRYCATDLRHVEQRALEVLALLPKAKVSRTRDVIQLDAGAVQTEDDIVVLVTAEAIELRLPTIEWTGGAYGPARSSELWRRLSTPKQLGKLAALLVACRAARKAGFITCQYCQRRIEPGHQHASDVCQGCAERVLQVVH